MHAASLYPLLYRLERQRLIEGRWVEKPGERRRRFYRLTAEGKRQLDAQRKSWLEFARAIGHVESIEVFERNSGDLDKGSLRGAAHPPGSG